MKTPVETKILSGRYKDREHPASNPLGKYPHSFKCLCGQEAPLFKGMVLLHKSLETDRPG